MRQSGRSVLCVGADVDTPSFAHTIGNALKGLPELLIIGTHKGALLDDLSQKMIERGRAFDDGELVSLGGKFPVKIITTNDARAQSEFAIRPVSSSIARITLCSKFLSAIATGAFPTTRNAGSPFPPSPC